MLQAYRGELKPAARNLAWSIATSRQLGIAAMELLCLGGEALVHEAAKKPEAPTASYRQLMNLWLTTEDRHDVVPGFTSAVVFFTARGEINSAAEFAAA